MKRLEGKVAIITGGGQGVGLGIARAFAREGARVVITGRTHATLQNAAEQLRSLGAESLTIVGNVRDPAHAKQTVADTISKMGRLDILVNNAQSITNGVMLEDTTAEMLAQNVESGLYGSFHFMQAALPHMKRQRSGKIINLGSRNGVEGTSGFSAYAATKEAIRGLSRSAAREWGRHNIQVNVINPAALSPAADRYLKEYPERAEKILSQIALGRLGDCDTDIGRAALFFATADSDYVTGQTLNVDGGQVML